MTKEKFKTYGDVFDNFTVTNIQKLISQKIIDGLVSPISIGKESNVFSASKDEKKIIIKIYRLETCDFNKMFSYLRTDPRFPNLRKNKRKVIFEWAKREYVNLLKARDAGVRVPMPIAFKDNIIVMEYIGEKDVSPKIKDIQITKDFGEKIVNNMKKLNHSGMVHGDLSEFNILSLKDNPVFIDFSQATTLDDPNAAEWFSRDVKNISRFLNKNNIGVDEATLKKKVISKK